MKREQVEVKRGGKCGKIMEGEKTAVMRGEVDRREKANVCSRHQISTSALWLCVSQTEKKKHNTAELLTDESLLSWSRQNDGRNTKVTSSSCSLQRNTTVRNWTKSIKVLEAERCEISLCSHTPSLPCLSAAGGWGFNHRKMVMANSGKFGSCMDLQAFTFLLNNRWDPDKWRSPHLWVQSEQQIPPECF